MDSAEITRDRFVTDTKIKDKKKKIVTVSITNEDGRTSNVSLIEIILTAKKKKK